MIPFDILARNIAHILTKACSFESNHKLLEKNKMAAVFQYGGNVYTFSMKIRVKYPLIHLSKKLFTYTQQGMLFSKQSLAMRKIQNGGHFSRWSICTYFYYENLCTKCAFGYLSMKPGIHTQQVM